MSEYQVLAIFAGFVFAYSIVASRLERTPISGAIVYVACGFVLGPSGLKLVDFQIDAEALMWLAELSLAVCLFTDSANADLKVLRRIEALPMRLLLFGLPMTIAAGIACAHLMLDGLGFYEIALIGTMLAPTDAALGKAVVTNEKVPIKVRESLNVESGLNDGICVPVVLFFLAVAGEAMDQSRELLLFMELPVQVIGIGALVGIGFGAAGGFALKECATRGWVEGTWLQIPVIALAMLCYGTAQWAGGSGFIASFVGGLVFGPMMRAKKEECLKAADGIADTLAMATWFAFGTILTTLLFGVVTWQIIVYALLSLTVIRIVPVVLCLCGRGLRWDTLLFIGWFGPRGLASIVFLVMAIGAKLPGSQVMMSTVAWTITLSVVAHGVSANVLASRYGRRVASRGGVI